MGILAGEQSYMGIDIGSTGIKIVELKKSSGQAKLVSYGFSENTRAAKLNWQKDISASADIVNQIRSEAGITCQNAVSALPTFSVFSSVLNLTNISKKDLASAVHWEAKKVIPLPLEDMILDWKKIDIPGRESDSGNVKVLLTGAPKTLVKKYIDIFKHAQINLLSLETETFSLIRSLLGNDKSTIMIVELGASTTDVTMVDNGIPMLNRSIDIGGISITRAIGSQMGLSEEQAEQFKFDMGVNSLESGDVELPQAVIDTISPIINEIKYAVNLFQGKYKKNTEKVVLSGGSSLLPNLPDYLGKLLDAKVIIGDPWARVSYPLDIKPLLQEIGPRMAVSIGLAMREME